MKLVLDQELQKYNNLIDIMNDTLKAALSVIDGKSLINDKIEAFIDSFRGRCCLSIAPLVAWWYGGTKITSIPKILCRSIHRFALKV